MEFHSEATSVPHVLNVVQGEKDLAIQRRKYKMVKTVNLTPPLIGSHCGFFLDKWKGERTVQLISPWPVAVNLVFTRADSMLGRIGALNAATEQARRNGLSGLHFDT